MLLSQKALKECFDAPLPEAASAHLTVAVCYSQLSDQPKRQRYLQFADTISRDLVQVPADLVIVLELTRVRALLGIV